jgi:uncharacterized membrane-anchored protein
MRRPARILAIAIGIAAVQIGFLGSMILGRAAILREGAEIRLAVEPVDPRDLLRGDFVSLSYGISRLEPHKFSMPRVRLEAGRRVFVRLAPSEDGVFRMVDAEVDGPVQRPLAEGEVDLLGTVQSAASQTGAVWVRYGIERYYVPEGEGRAIEDAMRQDRFEIVAAVDEDGSAQIKALLHDGRAIYREPLF